MIKKQLKLIVILFISAVILITGFLILKPHILKSTSEDEERYDKDGDKLVGTSGAVYVFEPADFEKVSSVEIKNYGEPWIKLYRTEDGGSFFIQGYEQYAYDSASISTLVHACCSLTAAEKVNDPKDFKEYGIDGENSAASVTVTLNDNTAYKFYVGDKLVTGNAYYVEYEGKPYLYAVTTDIELLFSDTGTLFATALSQNVPASDNYNVTDFKLYRNNELFLNIQRIPDENIDKNDAFNYFKMVYPEGYRVSGTNYSSVLETFSDWQNEEVITVEISDDKLREYDLSEPLYEIDYTYKDHESKIYFGSKTDDGYIYTLSADYMTIGKIPFEKVSFLDYDVIFFTDMFLYTKNIDAVSEISVKSKDIDAAFALSGEGNELTVTRKRTGEAIDTRNFRQFYMTFLMAKAEGISDIKSQDNLVLTIAVTEKDGSSKVFNFYSVSTRKCFYTVNGIGSFYVSRDCVDKIISDAGKLINGESIDSFQKE